MFSWDESKRKKVIADHKIDFAKITDIFVDPFAIDFEDYKHSTDDEIRYILVGKTAEYGLIALFFTIIDEDKYHFITARRAEKWMVRDYEKNRRRR